VRSPSLAPTSRRRAGLRALLTLALTATASLVTVGALAAPASATPVTCDGNGTAGKRVQLLYVRGDGQPNNLATHQSKMVEIPAKIDAEFLEAAHRTGGSSAFRAVRWVTDASCVPTITSVVVPQSIMDIPDDGTTKYADDLVDWLKNNGYGNNDRKYVVWYERDACGLGYSNGGSDSPDASNGFNGTGHALIGVRSSACFWWGATAHELLHTLGAVQPSAPHGTPGSHCWDDQDIMCYDDGTSSNPLTVLCPTAAGDEFAENMIDCNGDDYFNVNPPAGSYLATHWNVANSEFLIKTAPGSSTAACKVAYTKSDWGNGFNADLTVTNTSSSALSTWQLTFSFAGNQTINSSWPGSFTQSGKNVTLKAGTPSSLAAGASVHTFFNANYSGTNANPTAFNLNGQPCTIA
jgi:hypothetical protein